MIPPGLNVKFNQAAFETTLKCDKTGDKREEENQKEIAESPRKKSRRKEKDPVRTDYGTSEPVAGVKLVETLLVDDDDEDDCYFKSEDDEIDDDPVGKLVKILIITSKKPTDSVCLVKEK